ncbi:MAG: sugar transferase [Bacteroidota bacterium]
MYKYIKRFFDILISLTGIILTSPILLFLTVIILSINKKNPFFIQKRPGLNGKIFNILKFKTMNDCLDINGKLLPDEDRLTRIGRFIRSTSLDELPQLINVLKGEMSLVGPRPLLVKYLPLYNKRQALRHQVRPGITGWTQVNGRNSISWEQKFELDVFYVENLSFCLDLKIIWLTLLKVIKRENINAADVATMKPFMGN